MVPTALSQIAEQIVNAVVSVIATYQFMVIYASSADVYSYGSGRHAGDWLSRPAAVVFLDVLAHAGTRRRAARDHSRRERDSAIAGELVLTVIPIILSQTIYQIGCAIDDFLFGNIMAEKGFSDAVISSLQGVFNTRYNQLINLPVAVATAMALLHCGDHTRRRTGRRRRGRSRKIDSVIKFNMVIAFPSAARLTVLAYCKSALSEAAGISRIWHKRCFNAGSRGIAFTITTSILQAELYASAGISFRSVADHSRDFGLGSAEIYRSGRIWSGHRKCVFSGDRESFEHESYGEEAVTGGNGRQLSGFR